MTADEDRVTTRRVIDVGFNLGACQECNAFAAVVFIPSSVWCWLTDRQQREIGDRFEPPGRALIKPASSFEWHGCSSVKLPLPLYGARKCSYGQSHLPR